MQVVHGRACAAAVAAALAFSAGVGAAAAPGGASASSSSATRSCQGAIARPDDPSKLRFAVRSARHTTCASAVKVLRAVGGWADTTKPDLGAAEHGTTYGYRCKISSTGDYAWKATCTKGTHVIRGTAAR